MIMIMKGPMNIQNGIVVVTDSEKTRLVGRYIGSR